MGIEVRGLSKSFGRFQALNDVSLRVASGELVALLGPSGSGKTTLLRIIAGLEAADAGSVILEGEDATDRNARDRRVGFVFQHYALFRHMSVFENVAFGLRVRPRATRPEESDIRHRVNELLELVQLDFMADRRPSELSGGQRQRVALARALLAGARVLVLDDPMSAVDTETERLLVENLRPAVAGRTVLVATQRLSTIGVADRAVVLDEGRIVEQGRPAALLAAGGLFTALFGDESVAA
jgi:sulfate/thiosulfate transport system ATP-binding protein